MSEPLSRAALDDAFHNSANAKGINPTSERIHDLAATALHYLDRVAELERDRDRWLRRADLAEARVVKLKKERDRLERDRDHLERDRDRWLELCGRELKRADSAEAGLAAAQEALNVYADPRNWGISEDQFLHKVVAWIGPDADHTPFPDAPKTARDALARGGGQQENDK